MADALADAIGRLRGIEGPTFHGLDGKRHINTREYTDAVTLAMAYLVEHPADEHDPLNDDFLASSGSDTESPACESGHEFKLPDGSLLFLWGYEGGGCYSVTLTAHPELDRNADDASGEINLGDIHTRGQFRRLAATLGITTTRGSQAREAKDGQ